MTRQRGRVALVVAAAAFGAIGALLLASSRAATYSKSAELESGTLTTGAAKVSGSGASDGYAVSFSGGGSGGASVTIAAAGDIAQDGAEKGTSDLIYNDASISTVLALGDNAYNSGTIDEYNRKYDPTWGRFKSKTKPTPGNHEYYDNNRGYNSYWNNPPEYYSFEAGPWHVISLNSQIDHGSGSQQVQWLKNDLAANPKQCVMAFWHQPRFTAGTHDDDSSTQPFWDVLYSANADVVLGGHSHTYERFAMSKPDGTVDTSRGIREFVVGTGGGTLGGGGHTVGKREFADTTHYGVIKMDLSSNGYTWKFVATGGAVLDQGSGTCH